MPQKQPSQSKAAAALLKMGTPVNLAARTLTQPAATQVDDLEQPAQDAGELPTPGEIIDGILSNIIERVEELEHRLSHLEGKNS